MTELHEMIDFLRQIYQGRVPSADEANEKFFQYTKLFRTDHGALRRLLYLALKELIDLYPENKPKALIATNMLLKDFQNAPIITNRANALRVIPHLITPQFIGSIERIFKQAIVSQNAYISSCSLCATLHLYDQGPDAHKAINGWSDEIVRTTESTKDPMVQFHGLQLIQKMKGKDIVGVAKTVIRLITRGQLLSPLTHVLVIRNVKTILSQSHRLSSQNQQILRDYLENSLRHNSQIVMYEAARTFVTMKGATEADFANAITILQIFLLSRHMTHRFAAVRTLSSIALHHPSIVSIANNELEQTMNDPNNQIATLATSTLLKTCNAEGIPKLMSQVPIFLSRLGEDEKLQVIESIQGLSVKYPTSYKSILNFCSTALRDDSAFRFKSAVVDTILIIKTNIPDSVEECLLLLCEFIEDCEFTVLATKILHLLGSEAINYPNPEKFIRYINNRLSLENSVVRAAAVDTLGKFGAHHENLRPKVIILLKRSLNDSDDEVRDRVAYMLASLEQSNPKQLVAIEKPKAYNLDVLQQNLFEYLKNPSSTPFVFNSFISDEPFHVIPTSKPEIPTTQISTLSVSTVNPSSASTASTLLLPKGVPELEAFTPVSQGSTQQLTLPNSDFTVQARWFLSAEDVYLFQFEVENNVGDLLLEKVTVRAQVGLPPKPIIHESLIKAPCSSIPPNSVGFTYLSLSKSAVTIPTISFTLQYNSQDCELETGEPDEMTLTEDEEYDLPIPLNLTHQP